MKTEAAHSIVIGRKLTRQYLQCYSTAELRIFGKIHFTHAALANLRADFVTTEFCACGKSHHHEGSEFNL